MRSTRRLALSLLLAACASACSERPPAHRSAEPGSEPPTTLAPEGPRVEFLRAGPGEVTQNVREFVAVARAQGRTPLVYVGATWCEPCQYFHSAATRGELGDQLPPLLLLEFDRDQDGPRLDAAGYGSQMIPLFVVPQPDGRPSASRIEGSIHGPTSPAQIVPRLLAILRAQG